MITAMTLAWVGILAGCWLGWQLLRQNGRLLLRLEELEKRLDTLEFGEDERPTGLSAGTEAPPFELLDLAGERQSLAQYRGQPVLLIFFNPACGFCRDLTPRLATLSKAESHSGNGSSAAHLKVLLVSTGSEEANSQLFHDHKLASPVLLQKETEVAAAYRANGTPSGYLINSKGKIASGLAIGAGALLQLAEGKGEGANLKTGVAGNGGEREDRFSNRSLSRSKIKRDGLKAGTIAPDFRLPRLDGRGELSLSELRGQRVLLVFSSPGCGPCNALAPELEEFHRLQGAGSGSPSPGGEGRGEGEISSSWRVVMISKGEPKENRAKVKEHGLTFPIVLQQQWEISRRYAMFATPVAYLINEQGIIAEDVAIGTESIQELCTRAGPPIERFLPA